MVAHAPQRIGSFVEIFELVACLLEFDSRMIKGGAELQWLMGPKQLAGLG